MARIAAAKGGGVSLAGARRGGRSQLKIALVGVLVLGGTLGLLNMTPRSLHTEMHTSNTRKELRELTGAHPLLPLRTVHLILCHSV
jgi:hypothetical protein